MPRKKRHAILCSFQNMHVACHISFIFCIVLCCKQGAYSVYVCVCAWHPNPTAYNAVHIGRDVLLRCRPKQINIHTYTLMVYIGGLFGIRLSSALLLPHRPFPLSFSPFCIVSILQFFLLYVRCTYVYAHLCHFSYFIIFYCLILWIEREHGIASF